MNRHVVATLLIVAIGGCETLKKDEPRASSSHQHIIITPDKLQWKPAPEGLPKGAEMAVIEGDPKKSGFFAMRARMPAGYRIAPHWHPAWERVTVLSGTMYLGEGETLDESKATALPAGSYTSMSPGMKHFAVFKQPTELLIATNGPWGVHYVNPSDDPRKQSAGK